MPTHARQQVREAIAGILNNSPLPSEWVSVRESRIQDRRDIYPYLMVYADNEQTQVLTIDSPVYYQHTANIVIVGLIKLPTSGETITIEDKMDAMALQIQTKLNYAALIVVLPMAKSLILQSTEMSIVMKDIDEPVIDHAEITQNWSVVYSTIDGVPGTLI